MAVLATPRLTLPKGVLRLMLALPCRRDGGQRCRIGGETMGHLSILVACEKPVSLQLVDTCRGWAWRSTSQCGEKTVAGSCVVVRPN